MYTKGFEEWWETQESKYAALTRPMQAACKELAWSGWHGCSNLLREIMEKTYTN